jgi:PST family polysaccharide transporter
LSLKQKTISGIAWNTIGKISNQILQFILSVILMRLLLPSDYGLLAMAMVLIGFAGIFSEFGFSSALIQNQNITESHKSSIFWLNIIIGSILTLLFFIFADTFAQFYNNENLTKVIKYLSFSFVISSINIVPGTLLQKEMRYDVINKIDVSIVLLSGILSVFMAFNGWGVMSLVFQSLFSQIVKVPLLYLSTKWKPKFIFNKNSIKELFSYSAYLTGFSIINYGARHSDDLLIGKFMGAESLGIYSRAYSLMLMPITQVISLVSNVMFPALSSIQNDKERVKRIFINVIQTIAFITFPMMIGLIAVADNFILGIFGSKWAEVTPIIQILAFVGVLQTIGNPSGWIYTSQGKTDWMFWWGVFGSGSAVIAIVIGVLIGSIYSVAMAYLIINIILAYPVIAIPGKLINMKFSEVYSSVLSILFVSIIMAVIVFFIGKLLPKSLPASIKLIIQVLLGAIIYLGTMWFFKVEAFDKIKTLTVEQFHFYKNKFALNK